MNIGDIMASNSKRVLYLYIDDGMTLLFPNTIKPVKVWQVVFNGGDCDMSMRRDRETWYRFNYEGVNYLGEHIFDQIVESDGAGCCMPKQRFRHRVLFTARARELFATHIDTATGQRQQYVVDR